MRLINRVLAALLSLALIAVSLLLIIEVIVDRASHRTAVVNWQTAYHWAQRNTWIAGSIRVTSGILILIGLVLLIAELKRPRVTRLAADPAEAGVDGIDTAYTRRGRFSSAISSTSPIRISIPEVTRMLPAIQVLR